MSRPDSRPTVRDHWDDPWIVDEMRPTDHGWPLYLGRPLPLTRGGRRAILTTDFVRYLESVRYRRGECRIPLGKLATGRVRKLLGFNMYDDLADWWDQHAEEIASTPLIEFARKYNFTPSRVSQISVAMFGSSRRPSGWWREDPARSLLIGDHPRQVVAEQLEISIGAVGRLRWVLRHEAKS